MGTSEFIFSDKEMAFTADVSEGLPLKLSDFSSSFRLFSKAASCDVKISFAAGGMTDPTGGAAGIYWG
jgi:hypothetical protein